MAALVAAKLLLQLGLDQQYGYFRDELYYLQLGGRVFDGPTAMPLLAPLLMALTLAVLGDSLTALHLLPALAGGGVIALTVLMVRTLGGRLLAQTLAGLCVLAAQARAAFFPQIGYEGVAARGRRSSLGRPTLNNNPGGASPTTSGFLADFNAVWEVDLFGRARRANEVVRAQYLATEEAQRGVSIMLQSQVATAYFGLLELERLLEIAQGSTNTFARREWQVVFWQVVFWLS